MRGGIMRQGRYISHHQYRLAWQNRLAWLGRIGAGRIFARNARMLAPITVMIMLMMAGGLIGCTSGLYNDDVQMSFDDYCAYRAAEGVHLPLCEQDEAGRMLALYALRHGCQNADPGSLTDCLYLETEVHRLILRDIDNMIDRDMMQMLP
jgi:hypothetical protein